MALERPSSNGVPRWAKEARAQWQYTGSQRPPFALAPQPGQRSVWDFPRPPALESVDEEVCVALGDVELARSRSCLRVLETASPPTYYIPPADVALTHLVEAPGSSWCEWKGEARYWSLAAEGREPVVVGWSYPEPFPEFRRLRNHLSFYPARVECSVGGVRVLPQPGGFYGGWITPDLVGPFKGEPGIDGL